MYDKQLWTLLRAALTQAEQGRRPAAADPGRRLRRPHRQRAPTPTTATTRSYAVNCVDRPQTGGLAQIEQDADGFAAQAPIWGALLAWGSLPCVYWPDPPTDAAQAGQRAGQRPDPGGRYDA